MLQRDFHAQNVAVRRIELELVVVAEPVVVRSAVITRVGGKGATVPCPGPSPRGRQGESGKTATEERAGRSSPPRRKKIRCRS